MSLARGVVPGTSFLINCLGVYIVKPPTRLVINFKSKKKIKLKNYGAQPE